MGIAVWKKISQDSLWADKDWTVKADADAVFLPSRLRTKLMAQEVTSNGIYLENCKYVNYGFFGNLEVISRKAAQTYIANLDDCVASLNYMGHEKETGSEPWGEKKNKKWTPDCATTMTPAMHPFKTPKTYFDCLKATQRGTREARGWLSVR